MPLYFQISGDLQRRIESGELPPGTRIPGEKQLAEEYGVSAITARAAMRVLLDQNLITRHAGRGSFVADWKEVKASWGLGSLEDILTTGLESELRLISWRKLTPPDWVAQMLPLDRNGSCLVVQLVRLCEGEPFLLTTAYYPPEIASRLRRDDFTRPEARSKLAIHIVEELCGVHVVDVHQTMTAELADPEVGEHLQIRAGAPVLAFVRENFTADRQLVQLARSHYRTDRYRYKINLSQVDQQQHRNRSWT